MTKKKSKPVKNEGSYLNLSDERFKELLEGPAGAAGLTLGGINKLYERLNVAINKIDQLIAGKE